MFYNPSMLLCQRKNPLRNTSWWQTRWLRVIVTSGIIVANISTSSFIHAHICSRILMNLQYFSPSIKTQEGTASRSFGLYVLCSAALPSGKQNACCHEASSCSALAANSRDRAGVVWLWRGFGDLIGVVVSGVVEVMADGRGQHDEQVDAVHLVPQVRQPDQTVHLRSGSTSVGMQHISATMPSLNLYIQATDSNFKFEFAIWLSLQKVRN